MTRPKKLLLVLAAACAVAVGGVVWWVDQGRHLFFPKNWGVVEAGVLYRSGQIHRRLIHDALAEHGIEVVVDCSIDEPGDEDEAFEREVAEQLGIRKVDVQGLGGWGDGQPNAYLVALREMARAKRDGTPLLLHCSAGSERTGGIVAVWRILFDGWDGERAWAEYLAYRDEPPENDVLPRFVNDHLPMLAARLEAEGWIAAVPDPLPRFGPAAAGEPNP